MKSVTEFWIHTLNKGMTSQAALTAEGKTPEEITAAIGESFKYEGDKLTHFMAALGVAAANLDKLSRVVVVTLTEGETAPPKAVKVQEAYYIPEFQAAPKTVNLAKTEARGGNTKKGKNPGAPKESPWGMTPEQKLAKKNAGANKAVKPS